MFFNICNQRNTCSKMVKSNVSTVLFSGPVAFSRGNYLYILLYIYFSWQLHYFQPFRERKITSYIYFLKNYLSMFSTKIKHEGMGSQKPHNQPLKEVNGSSRVTICSRIRKQTCYIGARGSGVPRRLSVK